MAYGNRRKFITIAAALVISLIGFALSFQSNPMRLAGLFSSLRNSVVPMENQLRLWLVRELRRDSGQVILLGRDNQLFEQRYVDEFNRSSPLSADELETYVRNTALLQKRLAQRGSALLVVVAPNKADHYQELLPSGLIDQNRVSRPDNYARLSEMLLQYSVNTIDASKLFQEWKRHSPYPLFPKSGTHWSYYGACRAAAAVLSVLPDEAELPRFDCEDVVIDEPRRQDKDLAELANLAFPEVVYERLAYPAFPVAKTRRPTNHLLLVGDSFAWQLIFYFNRARAFGELDFLYYFRSYYRNPRLNRPLISTPMDWSASDWREKAFSDDLVIVEVNPATFRSYAFDFLDAALAAAEKIEAAGRTEVRPPPRKD